MGSNKTTPKDEAELLSSIEGSALGGDYDDDDEFDPDLADLNDPDVATLGEAPMIGGRPHSHEMFGADAVAAGRATSPKLWASASQFPTASQFRVWRMENGVPVGLGAIAVDATEEDFVRHFYDAMPQPGESRFQFILRPINARGKELGKEINVNISEHHATLRAIRERKRREAEEAAGLGWGRGPGGGDVIVQGGNSDAGSYYAEEMGRMFEHSVSMAEEQTQRLQEQLERERAELREQERIRAEERIKAAENASSVTERMTEKLLQTDRARSAEALSAQKETSQLVMSTLTTTFSQQQEAARLQAEREKQLEIRRQEQERAFYERREKELEMQRQREREEAERRRREEREEHERKLERERQEAMAREAERKAELEARREQLRLEMEERRLADERRREQERLDWERRMAAEKQEREERERRDRERFEREKMEMERKAEAARLEWEQRREDMRREDERRERERREELERKEQQRQHELMMQQKQLELQAQKDREHAERMMEMARIEREAQREAQLARERAEREAREASDAEKQRRHELMLKEMEIQKERDREHAERMLQLSKLEAGGGGGLSGIVEMLGMDTPEVLSRIFGANSEGEGGWSDALPKVLGGLGEMAKVVMTARGAEGGAPAQAKTATSGPVRHGRRQAQAAEKKMVAVKTAQGVKLIPEDKVRALQQEHLRQMQEQGVKVKGSPQIDPTQIDLPDAPYRPPGMAEGDKDEISPQLKTLPQPKGKDKGKSEAPDSAKESKEGSAEAQSKLQAGSAVNTLLRAKEAGMKLPDQRKARRAVRRLADKLRSSEEEDWMGIVTGEITANISIYHYLQAVTVYAALAEANVEADLADRVVKALKESGMVPDDVLPYDEADFARIKASEAAESSDEEGGEA